MKSLLTTMLLGWLLSMTGAGHGGGCIYRGSSRGAAVWVASDRSRHQVLWLDRNLIEVERWKVPSPVTLAWSGGKLWLACAIQGQPDGPHRLVCLGRDGRILGSWNTGTILGLVSSAGGAGVYVLGRQNSGAEFIWLCTSNGEWEGPIPVPGANKLVLSATGVWVLGAPGRVAWIPSDSSRGAEFFETPGWLQSRSGALVCGDELWCRGATNSSPWAALNPQDAAWGTPTDRPRLPAVLASYWPRTTRERKRHALLAWLQAQGRVHGPADDWLVYTAESIWWLDAAGSPQLGQGSFGFLTGLEWVGPLEP